MIQKAILILVLLLSLAVGTIIVLGLTQPTEHEVSMQAVIHASPDQVRHTITDFSNYPQWREGVTGVTLVASPQGLVGTKFLEQGWEDVLFEVVQASPMDRLPWRMETEIADDTLDFGGKWIYELNTTDDGSSRLRITEQGFVRSFLFRALGIFFSKTATMERYLHDLADHLETSRT